MAISPNGSTAHQLTLPSNIPSHDGFHRYGCNSDPPGTGHGLIHRLTGTVSSLQRGLWMHLDGMFSYQGCLAVILGAVLGTWLEKATDGMAMLGSFICFAFGAIYFIHSCFLPFSNVSLILVSTGIRLTFLGLERRRANTEARQRPKNDEINRKAGAAARRKEEVAKQQLPAATRAALRKKEKAEVKQRAAEERAAKLEKEAAEAKQRVEAEIRQREEEEVQRAAAEQKLETLRQSRASLDEEVRRAEREVYGLGGSPASAPDSEEDTFNLQLQPCVICLDLQPVMLVVPCGHR